VIQLRFVPIESWPGEKTKYPKSSPFRSRYVQTLDDLETELNHLKAKEIVLQAAIDWQDIRNDGWPKSNAAFRDAGVILTFQTKDGPLSFPCDAYNDWQANLRAIALSLEALRAVNRYGVTRRAEQYQGWKRIAPPSDQPFGNKEDAARFIQSMLDEQAGFSVNTLINYATERQMAYRRAAAKLHPDTPGGSHDQFVKLQAALALLEGK
jgi:hypothetical protein